MRATLQQDAEDLLRQAAPGVLVELLARAGEEKVRGGVSDVDTGRAVPCDARFRIGSLTKPFVSTTLLQLVGEGWPALSDTLDRWLPRLVHCDGIDGRKITVRQLLRHTSGLPEYLRGAPLPVRPGGFPRALLRNSHRACAVRLALRYPADFAPATPWNYSNTDYVFAGIIVEEVTGRAWQRQVRGRIIRPLGLDDTSLPGTRVGIPGPQAVGYQRYPGPDATATDPDYGEAIDVTGLNPSFGGGAGETISTIEDTNGFLRALVRGRLLAPAQFAQMQRAVRVSAFRQNLAGSPVRPGPNADPHLVRHLLVPRRGHRRVHDPQRGHPRTAPGASWSFPTPTLCGATRRSALIDHARSGT